MAGRRGEDLSPPSACQNTTVPKNGKRLKVLSALALATVLYTVKPGDTLSGVAQQYNTTWGAIYHDNQSTIGNPNLIYAGERLSVPAGDQTTGVVPAQAPASQSSTSSSIGQGAPVQSYKVTTAPAPTPAQSTPDSASSSTSSTSSSALDDIPGVPESFAACVAYRESTDDTNPAADGNAYGIIPASGYNVSGDSIAQQKQVFEEIYDTTGPSAWAADGCAS
jgi:LysM repeat protein